MMVTLLWMSFVKWFVVMKASEIVFSTLVPVYEVLVSSGSNRNRLIAMVDTLGLLSFIIIDVKLSFL